RDRRRDRWRRRAGADRLRRPKYRAAFFDNAPRAGRARGAAPRPEPQRAVRTALLRGLARSGLAPTTQPKPPGTALPAAPAGTGAAAPAAATAAAPVAAGSVRTV